MTARLRPVPLLFGAIALGTAHGLVPATLAAQRAPQGNAPFILVTAFRTPDHDKRLAVQAADAMRSRLSSVVSSRDLYVIPKQSIEVYLEGSGYAKDEPLNAIDARQLGQVLRADEVLMGTVARTDAGFRLGGSLALIRDMAIREPIPEGEGKDMTAAAADFTRKVQEVRKQLPHERNCTNALRDGKYDEAEAAARAGIVAYPPAIISRICLMFSLSQAQKSPEEVLAAASDVLTRDPRQPRALLIAMEQYRLKGDTAEMARTASELVAVEAGNVALVEQIVANLEAMRRADVALPILERALAETPEDPDLLRLQFRLLIASARWKEVIQKGELLAQVDTASVDQKYFERMAAAYQADSQPQKAAEVLARGVAKYPEDPMLAVTLGQLLQSIGQLPQSIEVLRGALRIEPKLPNARLLIARAFNDMQQPDSVFSMLREAAEAGDDKTQISGFAVTLANAAFRHANETKVRDDWKRVHGFAVFADSVEGNVNAKFFRALSAFFIGDALGNEASSAKSCPLAREAKEYFDEVQVYLPQGGSVSPETAGQILTGALPQWMAAIEQQIAAFCR